MHGGKEQTQCEERTEFDNDVLVEEWDLVPVAVDLHKATQRLTGRGATLLA